MRQLAALLVILAVKTSQAASSFRNARLDDSSGPDAYGTPGQSSGSSSAPPYPPSGWAPSGDLFLLPGETHSSQQNYGPPPPPSPPANQYGPVGTTEQPTTVPDPNQDTDASEGDGEISKPDSDENGQYYVLLPGGKLQKVQYSGKQRARGQYEAQIQYEEVDPVRTPVYSYQSLPVQIPF